MDCGPACVQMVCYHYGKRLSAEYIRSISNLSNEGTSVKDIIEAISLLGFTATPLRIDPTHEQNFDFLQRNLSFPVIAHWNNDHFVVIYKMTKKYAWVADPGVGKYKVNISTLFEKLIGQKPYGVVIAFNNIEDNIPGFEDSRKDGFRFLLSYLSPFKKFGWQLLLGILVSNLIALIFPFLTQAVVDSGIANRDISIVNLILLGQLTLFIARIFTQYTQAWIILHIGARLNISFINDFLKKLMSLPIGYFDKSMTGDLLQRIADHKRIENFFTGTAIGTFLSIFNLISFGFVLLYYSTTIFVIFAISAVLYFSWIIYFLKIRERVDHESFKWNSEAKDNVIELIMGMPDIKLSGSEVKRRWKWTEIQVELFGAKIKSLKVSQLQDVGASIINQLKDILITVTAAKMVISGHLTLGMMLAIQFITGQLNGPLSQLIGFIRGAQDAKISLKRLKEIHNIPSEDSTHKTKKNSRGRTIEGDIVLSNIRFKHGGSSKPLFDNLSLTIPHGKTTAIVGTSGSGKTTLLKLLLGYYDLQSGSIMIGDQNIKSINLKAWRKKCGVVDQEGFLFSDSIANNVGESSPMIIEEEVNQALHVANLEDFIAALPNGIDTPIGRKGNGVSQGQKQRILIARAVFKNPTYLFFDEATNSLDAETERVITQRLNGFLQNKTAIIVAHRLSTVTHADNIIVLSNGEIIEQGRHDELIALNGQYFNLIKNQLELGK